MNCQGELLHLFRASVELLTSWLVVDVVLRVSTVLKVSTQVLSFCLSARDGLEFPIVISYLVLDNAVRYLEI
jgi:hypothetical protein